VLGGLVDITPLERLVAQRIPWPSLRANLDASKPGALCVACTEIQTGRVIVFMDGELADVTPWDYDPYVKARHEQISPLHVRASAAIPFLFPAVRIGETYYLDGGLRVNTPLSPALRLRASKVLVVGLKRELSADAEPLKTSERAITQPAFLLGKVLNVLLLDQLEHDLRRLELLNTLLDAASTAYGNGCLETINASIRNKRGVEYRKIDTAVVRPSADIGAMAADAYHRRRSQAPSRGLLPFLLARLAVLGVPEREADLLSYLYFDASFTRDLIELGREDARRKHDRILETFTV
jgi:NTE family protein